MPSVVSVDKHNGKAVALSAGNAEVIYKTGVIYKCRVIVVKISNILKGKEDISLDYVEITKSNLYLFPLM